MNAAVEHAKIREAALRFCEDEAPNTLGLDQTLSIVAKLIEKSPKPKQEHIMCYKCNNSGHNAADCKMEINRNNRERPFFNYCGRAHTESQCYQKNSPRGNYSNIEGSCGIYGVRGHRDYQCFKNTEKRNPLKNNEFRGPYRPPNPTREVHFEDHQKYFF